MGGVEEICEMVLSGISQSAALIVCVLSSLAALGFSRAVSSSKKRSIWRLR